MADLDRLLRPVVSEAAAEAAQLPDFASIQRRGVRRRRTRAALGAAAVVAVLLGVGGSLRILGVVDAHAPSPVDQRESIQRVPDHGEIEPGTYRVPRSLRSAVAYEVTFPEGWSVRSGNQFDAYPGQRTRQQATIGIGPIKGKTGCFPEKDCTHFRFLSTCLPHPSPPRIREGTELGRPMITFRP